MKLIDVYKAPDAAEFLYTLLEERTPEQSISHRKMPPWRGHVRFFKSRPYRAWYLIKTRGEFVGAVYLSRADEIGIFVLRKFQGSGLGPKAVHALMKAHPRRRYLANVNPANKASDGMFRRLGFSHLQTTYELRHA
jgi:RimJ/RimL family protein N-acetyltransferase